MATADAPERWGTGDPALDEVLRGGLPIGGLTVVCGPPGAGKSVLAHQVCRQAGTRAVYALAWRGSPEAVAARHASPHPHYVDLAPELSRRDPEQVLAAVAAEVDGGERRLVIIDCLDAVCAGLSGPDLREWIDRLMRLLWAHQATGLALVNTSALGEGEHRLHLLASAAVLVLALETDTGARPRTLRVVKYEGTAYAGGLHSFRIGPQGLRLDRSPELAPAAVPVSELGGRILAVFRTSRRCTLDELAVLLSMPPEQLEPALAGLVADGYLSVHLTDDGERCYVLPTPT